MPVNFTPYLGWADATDVTNIPAGLRLISAADLLRYENYAEASKTLINSLETQVTALKAAPAVLVKTTSYALALTDTIAVGNGAALTLTLPTAAAAGAGRIYRIKNINASALTVASAGGTIDGATTKTLTQWAAASYVSTGTVWYSI